MNLQNRVFWGPEEKANFEVPGLVNKKQIGFTKSVHLLNTLVVKTHVLAGGFTFL